MGDPVMDGSAGRRLAIYTRSLRPCSGSSRVILSLAQELVAAGHELHVFGQRLDAAAIRSAGAQVHRHWTQLLPRQVSRALLGARGPARLVSTGLSRGGYAAIIGDGDLEFQDVLLLHTVIRREVEALAAGASARLAAQVDSQEAMLRGQRWRLVLANSRLMRHELLERYRLREQDVVVVHPGVDAMRFHPDPVTRQRVRAALGVADDQLLLGFITSGNFPLRGMDTLVELLAGLKAAACVDLRLLALCSPHNAQLLTAAARAQGCVGSLIIRPRLDAVEQYLQALDLLVHPARFETFGLVISEAAACGCPVVTSELVGASELFSGEARAGVVAQPTPEAMAPLLQSLAADPARRSALARAQRDQVLGFSWQRYAAGVLKALTERELLHGEVAPTRG